MNTALSTEGWVARRLEAARRRTNAYPGRPESALETLIDLFHATTDRSRPEITTHALCVGMLAARIAGRLPPRMRPDPLHLLCAGQLLHIGASQLRFAGQRAIEETLCAFRSLQTSAEAQQGPVTAAGILHVADHFNREIQLLETDQRKMPREVLASMRTDARFHPTIVAALRRAFDRPEAPLWYGHKKHAAMRVAA